MTHAISELILALACWISMRRVLRADRESLGLWAATCYVLLGTAALGGALRYALDMQDNAALASFHNAGILAAGLVGFPFMGVAVAGWLGQTWMEKRFRRLLPVAFVFLILLRVLGIEGQLLVPLTALAILWMILAGLLATTRSVAQGLSLVGLSLLFILKGTVITAHGESFGISHWHIYHLTLAFWAYAMSRLLTAK